MDSRFDIEHGTSFKEILEKRLFEISIDNADQWIPDNGIRIVTFIRDICRRDSTFLVRSVS